MSNIKVFFDLETSGKDINTHAVTQIGAVAVNEEWETVDEFECKVLFKKSNSEPEALEVSCYNEGIWKNEAVVPKMACTWFGNFLSDNATVAKMSRNNKPYHIAQLAGHNAAKFDSPFLMSWFKRLNMFCPATVYTTLDTLPLSRWLLPELPSHKLGVICDHLGIELTAHDALSDAKATAKVAEYLMLLR